MFDINNIILFILVIILIYLILNTKNMESYENIDVINALNDYYQVDLNGIRNLSTLTNEMQTKTDSINLNNTILNNIKINKTLSLTNKLSALILLPPNMIIIWYDTNIPDGWVICDGTNGTPDLRGRMILGADNRNNNFKFGANPSYGGTEAETISTTQMPYHSHQGPVGVTGDIADGGSGGNIALLDNNNGTHISGSTGNNNPHNNMPPFTVLYYIMKLPPSST
jgi:hypothetical protein